MARIIKSDSLEKLSNNLVSEPDEREVVSLLPEADSQTTSSYDEVSLLKDENEQLKARLLDLQNEYSSLEATYKSEIDKTVDMMVAEKLQGLVAEQQTKLDEKLASLDALIKSITDEYRQYLNDNKDNLADILFHAATRLVATKYSSTELQNIIIEAIKEVSTAERIFIYISRQDSELVDMINIPEDVAIFKSDARVKHGGCIIEAESTRLDCRLETRLEIFKNILIDTNRNVN